MVRQGLKQEPCLEAEMLSRPNLTYNAICGQSCWPSSSVRAKASIKHQRDLGNHRQYTVCIPRVLGRVERQQKRVRPHTAQSFTLTRAVISALV